MAVGEQFAARGLAIDINPTSSSSRLGSENSVPVSPLDTYMNAKSAGDNHADSPNLSPAADSFLVQLAQAQGRRGSQLSGSSHIAPYLHNNRASLSSLASSTDSPRVPPSSNGTTIGDLSTSSMPLLSGVRRDDESLRFTSWSNNASAAERQKKRTGSTSSYVSDASSHVSQPSSRKNNNGISISTTNSPIARRNTASSSSARSINSRLPPRSATNPFANPFGPLRKRLIRSIGACKRVGVEVQLFVELVDALELYIRFTSSPSPVSERIETFGSTEVELQKEIHSLLTELCEVAPDAERCLTSGVYDSLAFPPANRIQRPSNESLDPSSPNWWPRRLARDCRVLLEQVGFVTASANNGSGLTITPTNGPTTSSNSSSPSMSMSERSKTGWNHIVDAIIREGQEDGEGGSASGSGGDGEDGRTDVQPESPTKVARQQELLLEGRKRWAAYRKAQQLAGESNEEDQRTP